MREATIRSRIRFFDSGAYENTAVKAPAHHQTWALTRYAVQTSEITEEIGVSTDTIYRSYLPAGLPHTRDGDGNVWIHGPAFIAWARETISKKKSERAGLPDGRGWCMKCNQAVQLIDPKIKTVNRYLELLQAVAHSAGKLSTAPGHVRMEAQNDLSSELVGCPCISLPYGASAPGRPGNRQKGTWTFAPFT